MSTAPSFAAVLYVDADAAAEGDGRSWCAAYRFLQDALAEARGPGSGVVEIRVAGGTYRPDAGTGQTSGDRTATFRMVKDVILAGGYAGCGFGDPDRRDFSGTPSILSGDLLGNDGAGFLNHDENSYHVAVNDDPGATNTMVLDGFTVRGGHANGTLADKTDQGSGFHNFNGVNPFGGKPLVQNCLFEDNWAANHGAVNDHGGMTLRNCTFLGNHAGMWGGGLYIHHHLATLVQNCSFMDNTTDGTNGGGAGVTTEGEPIFQNCSFSGNVSATNGGGMYNHGEGNPTLIGCTFQANHALKGGAMYNSQAMGITATGCVFSANTAGENGGAMYFQPPNLWTQVAALDDCTLSTNSAPTGGGIYLTGNGNDTTRLTLRGCTLDANRAEGPDVGTGYVGGGGIWLQGGVTVRAIECKFRNNTATTGGGALFSTFTSARPGSGGVYSNCLFTANDASYGGVLAKYRDNTTFVNCAFSGNHAAGDTWREGGAVINDSQDSDISGLLGTKLISCTLAGNTSEGLGGAVYHRYPFSLLTVTNSIFWANKHLGSIGGEAAAVFWGFPGTGLTVSHSCVEGWSGVWGGMGNVGDDPLFTDMDGTDNIVGTSDDRLWLQAGSPLIDGGNVADLPADADDLDQDGDVSESIALDLNANPRLSGEVDMGAYEFCDPLHLFGDVNRSGTVNFMDIALVVSVFQNRSVPVPIANADLHPCQGDGLFNFQDISAAVDAFQQRASCATLCAPGS